MTRISMPPQQVLPPNPRRSGGWGLAIVTALGFLMLGLTNPNQADYSRYAAWKLREMGCGRSKSAIAPQVPKGVAQFTCTALTALPPSVTAQMLSQYTRRENYIFFSVYRTQVLSLELRGIGIAGHFILL